MTSEDGENPVAGLIADKWSNLYGSTENGGADEGGTVFELSPPVTERMPWNQHVLWTFVAFTGDGEQPFAGLIADKWGNLYGTTNVGGTNTSCGDSGCGTVFKLSLPGPGQ